MQICEVDGNTYRELDKFTSGTNECAKCVCTSGEVQCDVKECQKLVENVPKTKVSSNENEVNSEGNIIASSWRFNSKQPVNQFRRFTENLYKRYLNVDRNPTDYTDITDQFGSYLAKNDFESKSKDSHGRPCENFKFSYDRFQDLSSYLTKINYIVKDLYEQRDGGIAHNINKKPIHSSDTQIINNTPLSQEASSVAYSATVTKTTSVTITKTHGFGATAGITIFFLNFGGSYRFDRSKSIQNTTTETSTVTAPSQKVILEPFTKVNVTYNFYQYDDVYKYLLDFEIDEKSSMTRPDFRYMYYGDLKCCEPCLLFKTSNVIRSPLKRFFKENNDAFQSIVYKNDTVVKVEQENGKFILRNIPAIEKIQNFGVDIIYGTAEKL